MSDHWEDVTEVGDDGPRTRTDEIHLGVIQEAMRAQRRIRLLESLLERFARATDADLRSGQGALLRAQARRVLG